MKRGQPFEPGNKVGRGRPRGGRNKKTQIAQDRRKLIETHEVDARLRALEEIYKDFSAPPEQ